MYILDKSTQEKIDDHLNNIIEYSKSLERANLIKESLVGKEYKMNLVEDYTNSLTKEIKNLKDFIIHLSKEKYLNYM